MLKTSSAYKIAVARPVKSGTARISFGVYDVAAKDDAEPTADSTQPFTDAGSVTDNVRVPGHRIATLEKDFWKLDGSFVLPGSDLGPGYHLGWWSQALSGADGYFVPGQTPALSIDFGDLHSSLGLMLFFDALSPCSEVAVTWHQGAVVLKTVIVTENTAAALRIDTPVENYNRITVEFVRTLYPHRYARLMEIDFGVEEIFEGDRLIAASIIEESDPVSATLPVNKLTFTVENKDQRFNMLSPDGLYVYLQRRQQIIATAALQIAGSNYEEVPLGNFFLSQWKNSTGLTATLEATDALGLLDRTTYYASPFWENEPIANVIEHILADAGKFAVTVAPEVVGEAITGYIPVMSHREALQLVLVASRAALRNNRQGILMVYRPNYAQADKDIDYSLILAQPQIEQRELITAVTANEYAYILENDPVELFRETLDIDGTREVTIVLRDAPTANVNVDVTGGTLDDVIISTTTVIATITGSGSAEVIVTGRRYIKNTRRVTASIETLPAGELPQVAELADNPLLCGNAAQVTAYLLAYYGRRIKQTVQFWADPALQAGDCADVETMFGQTQKGVVESQELEFAPALKARLTIVG